MKDSVFLNTEAFVIFTEASQTRNVNVLCFGVFPNKTLMFFDRKKRIL